MFETSVCGEPGFFFIYLVWPEKNDSNRLNINHFPTVLIAVRNQKENGMLSLGMKTPFALSWVVEKQNLAWSLPKNILM